MGTASTTAECVIKNKLGLHARPASLFVQTAAKFDSDITVRKGDEVRLLRNPGDLQVRRC